MSDNVTTQSTAPATPPSGSVIAARSVTYSGDTGALIAPVGLVSFAGSDDAKTATDVPLPTALGAGGGVKVDGSGTALPISAASLPLPTGAATSAKQPALGTAGTASSDVLSVQGIASMTALKTDGSGVTQPVSGTFWQATQPVSAAALPLPSGASTAAKQPALGTAGAASADVITVQGVTSMTALKVDGSAVTQPVSGTFWQATQPVSLASVPSHAVTNAGTFAVQAAQSGTWTVQPGNTANTVAWKVDGSAVTQPVSGTVTAAPNVVSSATLANVAGSASSVTLIASNASRKGAIIYNDSTVNLRIKFGSTASATSFTYLLGPGATWEMTPAVVYTGIITGIWDSATGNARTTEL